jgi:hypothetical protein
MCPPVGASLLAMVVNDNAGALMTRGALEAIASKLAPAVLDCVKSIKKPAQGGLRKIK